MRAEAVRRPGRGGPVAVDATAGEATVATVGAVREDRVLGTTRALAVIVAPVLLVASTLLFGFPDRTDEHWAWTIRPTMTAMLMGAGYFSGILYFLGVARARSWSAVGVMFLPITAFVVFMAAATALHWDRFDLAHPSAWAWIALYAVTPLVLPWAWWRNQRHDPGVRPGDARFAPGLRVALGATGAVALLVLTGAFLRPTLLIDVWPWALSPLTARVVLGWYALPAALFVALAVDGRVRSVGLTLRSALAGLVLVLVATARGWDEFDPAGPGRWLFVAFFVALLGLFAWMTYAARSTASGGGPSVQDV